MPRVTQWLCIPIMISCTVHQWKCFVDSASAQSQLLRAHPQVMYEYTIGFCPWSALSFNAHTHMKMRWLHCAQKQTLYLIDTSPVNELSLWVSKANEARKVVHEKIMVGILAWKRLEPWVIIITDHKE